MTITQLETFLKICEMRNFTSAAGSLGYAQSTVTTQIRQLEDELGTQLFERLGKTIVITPAGEKLMIYAAKLLQIEREIHLEVPDNGEPAGAVKLGVSESLCYSRIPQILMEYKKQYPQVDIRLQFIMHDTFPDLLKNGELDIVYTLNPLIEDENLKLIFKRPESLGFYCSPSHPLARKKRVTEEDLEDVPLLLTSHNCSFKHMLLNAMEQAGVSPLIELETDSKEVLKQFASNGLGVAFMPDMTVVNEVADKRLARLNWKGTEFRVFSQVFIHKDKHVNAAVAELIRLFEEGATAGCL